MEHDTPQPDRATIRRALGQNTPNDELWYLDAALSNARVKAHHQATRETYERVERDIGDNIRRQRLSSEMSQENLATAMTIQGFPMHQTTVAKVEAGKRPLRVAELYAFADALDVPLLALMTDRRITPLPVDNELPVDQIEEQLVELMLKRDDALSELSQQVEEHARRYGEYTAQIQFRIASILDASASVHRSRAAGSIDEDKAEAIALKWIDETGRIAKIAEEQRSWGEEQAKQIEMAQDRQRGFEERNADAIQQIIATERAFAELRETDPDGTPA